LVSKDDIFTPFCYKFIQVTACKKWILDLSLVKLVQFAKRKGCIFCLTVYKRQDLKLYV